GIRFRSVGTAGLRHVRPPAAAFAAKRLGALAHQIDGVEATDEIVGDADDDAGFAILGNTDNSDNPRADFLLALVGKAAEILQVDALDRACHEFDVTDDAYAVGAVVFSATSHGELLLRLRQLALDALALVEQNGDTARHFVDRHAQFGSRGLGETRDVIGIRSRGIGGQCLDAAHACGNTAFSHHRDETDVAGAPHMRAAAQFDRPAHRVAAALPHGDDAHLIAIFFAEQCTRARGDGIVAAQQPGNHRRILQHDVV